MNKLIKLTTFFILLISLVLLISSSSLNTISNSILTILPSSKEKSLLLQYDKLKSSKILFLCVKGLDNKAYNKIINLEKKVEKVDFLTLKKETSNNFLNNYKYKNYLYLNKFDKNKFDNLDLDLELSKLYTKITNSFFPVIINKKDPLGIFKKRLNKSNIQIKNSHLILKDYGYISFFSIDKNANSLEDYKKIYNQVITIKKEFSNIKIFSPIFYYVENQKAIKDDVNKIILFATITLFILYILILRNLFLLIHTTTVLTSSIILSIVFLSYFFNEISIFTLVFGISISTVAIDYMFHLYMHDYYKYNKGFNKEVFYGFFTTVIAFFIISFTSFELIKQICIFAIFTLTLSYLQFSLLFPKIRFKRKDEFTFSINTFKIKPIYIIFFSTILIILSSKFISFDTNLKNLDYDNKKLKIIQEFFDKKFQMKDKIKILIEAKNVDELLKKIDQLKPNLSYVDNTLNTLITKTQIINTNKLLNSKKFLELKDELNKKSFRLGFKKDFFNNSYKTEKIKSYTKEELKKLNIQIFTLFNNIYISTNINKSDFKLIKNKKYIYPLSFSLLFEKSLKKIENKIFLLGVITLLIIFSILYIVTKRSFLSSINFILFPISIILIYSYFTPFNILHIFMIFIILALCIDYAIYYSKNSNIQTNKAIAYSLLSTFAGFGVLIFSNINSLKSIGTVTTIAVISITLLLIFLKRHKNETYRS